MVATWRQWATYTGNTLDKALWGLWGARSVAVGWTDRSITRLWEGMGQRPRVGGDRWVKEAGSGRGAQYYDAKSVNNG